MRFVIAAVLALAMSFPAFAQVCMFTMETTIPQLEEKGTKYVVLDAGSRKAFLAELAKAADAKGIEHDLSDVTDVLLAELDGEIYFGLVRAGCLSPPVPLSDFLPGEKLSGRAPDGKTGA